MARYFSDRTLASLLATSACAVLIWMLSMPATV